MTFDEILEQAIGMLQRRGRVSYGALKRQFALDDEYLADLKSELVEVLAVAADKDGKMLVWVGEEPRAGSAEHGAKSDEAGRATTATAERRFWHPAPGFARRRRAAAVDSDVH